MVTSLNIGRRRCWGCVELSADGNELSNSLDIAQLARSAGLSGCLAPDPDCIAGDDLSCRMRPVPRYSAPATAKDQGALHLVRQLRGGGRQQKQIGAGSAKRFSMLVRHASG